MSIEFESQLQLRNLPDIQPHAGAYDSEAVDACRRLVARRYRQVGYVDDTDIDENGYLGTHIDPYVDRSEYFWKLNPDRDIDATLRVIRPDLYDPEDSLPIEQSFDLYDIQSLHLKEALRNTPDRVGEISALAKEKGVDRFAAMDMYREVWQYGKRSGIDLYAISADATLYAFLKSSFGNAIVQAGDAKDMMGSLTVPCLLHTNDCAQAMVDIYRATLLEKGSEAADEYKGIMEYLRFGLEPEYFSDEELAVLETIGM